MELYDILLDKFITVGTFSLPLLQTYPDTVFSFLLHDLTRLLLLS